jgi:hypothetical protein
MEAARAQIAKSYANSNDCFLLTVSRLHVAAVRIHVRSLAVLLATSITLAEHNCSSCASSLQRPTQSAVLHLQGF